MADGAAADDGSSPPSPQEAVEKKIDEMLQTLEGVDANAEEAVATPEAAPLANGKPAPGTGPEEGSDRQCAAEDDAECADAPNAQDVSIPEIDAPSDAPTGAPPATETDAPTSATTAEMEERLGAISSRLKDITANDEAESTDQGEIAQNVSVEYIGTVKVAMSGEDETTAMAPTEPATKDDGRAQPDPATLAGEKDIPTDSISGAPATPPSEIAAATVATVGRRGSVGESSQQSQSAPKGPTDVADPDDFMEPSEDANKGDAKDDATEPAPQIDHASQGLGKEILFDDSLMSIRAFDDGSQAARQRVQGWTNQRWSAAQKNLRFTAPILRVGPGRFFWSADVYEKRILAIYNNPDVILIMRVPKDIDEVRRLLPIKGGMGMSQQELHQFLVVESMADPQTCKVRLSQLTHATSLPSNRSAHNERGQGLRNSLTNNNVPRRRACFDLLTPTELVTLSVAFLPDESFEDAEYISSSTLSETHRCEDAIVSALVDAYTASETADSNPDLAWRHQVVLGTPHSFVVSGNDQTLQDSLHQALEAQNSQHEAESNSSPSTVLFTIDAKDDSGKTALHYACSRRQNATVQILVGAGADCSVPQSGDLRTPCHMCAAGLDEKSLSVVLSSSYPTRPSPNALDNMGRTPMYLAAVEGRDRSESRNANALDLCLSALAAWGGQLIADSPRSKFLLHPVHCVSAQWEADVLSVILSHCNYHYPLAERGDLAGRSLSAKFHYPIHAAVLSLRSKIVEAFSTKGGNRFNAEFMPQEPPIVKTIQTLLDHGFEPNERIEGVVGQGEAIKSFSCYFGFTPLQALALVAAEARSFEKESKAQEKEERGTDTALVMRNVTRVIKSCAELLVKNGARTNVPPPPPTRLDREPPAGCYSLEEALVGQDKSFLEIVYRETLDLEGKEEMLALFGSSQWLSSCQNIFAEAGKSVDNTTLLTIGSSSVDSHAPGGSDPNSCAICWSEFGVISNRKHLCRVSCRNVCNECSRKRLVDNGAEQRVSDGQFLLAKAEIRKAAARSLAKRDEHMRKQRQSVTQARKSLGLRGSTGSAGSEDDKTEVSTADRLSNAISGLGQAKNAVLERGDKLEGIADKAEKLNKASVDFAKMAKELERSQNSWW